MAFDAGMLRAVTHEVRDTLFGGARVERVLQTSRDEFVLVLHAGGKNRRLCFSAGGNVPHFSYSRVERENLPTPSMFCMLLRKHLVSGKLVGAEQIDFERAARFSFACRDELGYPVTRTLVAEMMGKYSNLILLDGEEKILSALRIVDFSASRLRQVLPGMRYEKPPLQDKQNPLDRARDRFMAAFAAYPAERQAARFLTDTYCGIAVQNAREMVRRASGSEETLLAAAEPAALYAAFDAWFGALEADRFCPTLLTGADGTPTDFSYMSLGGGGLTVTHPASFGELLDGYFGERDRAERLRQRSADLARLLARRESGLARKLELRREELAACEQGGEYKTRGNLITENLYRLSRGMESFVATDYRADPPCEVTVPLDPRLHPTQNAQKMYKQYTKARRAKEKLTSLIAEAEEELQYLRGVRAFLERAEGEQDFADLRAELASAGILSPEGGRRGAKYTPKARPMEFFTSGGYRLLCGRNNLQNEMLTLHMANRDDLWFHAKGVGGAHVILQCAGEEPPAADYTEAAEVAAYFSQGGDALTAVDYTRVRNIKKPAGSRPGFVTYKTNYTAYVLPKKPKGGEGETHA